MILTHPSLTGRDGTPLRYFAWPAPKPRAAVVLLHGMAEHVLRYAPLAERLNRMGLSVYALEYRGHGEGADKLGFFSLSGGFDLVLSDVMRFYAFTAEQCPGLPLLVFGHSMGTIFARALMMSGPAPVPRGCLLSGVTVDVPLRRLLAPGMIALIGRLQGGMDQVSPLVMQMSIGAFSKAVPHAKTDCDWLSRDEAAVQAYRDDPLCGFPLTSAMMRDVAVGVLWTLKGQNEQRLPDNAPTLICVGEKDPVGGPKAAAELEKRWRRRGKPVLVQVYPGARHELLNETCREEFLSQVMDFYEDCLQEPV